MEIAGINSSDPLSLAPQESSDQLGRDSFMKLLVTQLKSQDPLQPAKNEDMLAQLAQFSSLEEMEELNENIVGLAVLQQSNALMSQLTDSSALIDKSVHYIDPNTNGARWGTVSSVRIIDGIAVLHIDGADVPLANITEVGPIPQGDGSADGSAEGSEQNA